MNLLLVDDEVISVKAMLDGVRWARCGVDRVFTAYTADEARKLFLAEQIDLALLDIEMPGEDGLSLLRWIRSVEKVPVPCAFLTCHAKFEYAREAVSLHCSEYLLKPVDYVSVEELILGMIAEIPYGQQLQAQKEELSRGLYESVIREARSTADQDDVADQVTAFVLENLTEESLAVKDIADHFHLNPDYLNRLFKKKNGMAINTFLIQQRMQLAMKLLTDGGMPATAVAEAVGYQHYANFVNMFKKIFGKLPSQVTGK